MCFVAKININLISKYFFNKIILISKQYEYNEIYEIKCKREHALNCVTKLQTTHTANVNDNKLLKHMKATSYLCPFYKALLDI